MNKKSYWMVVVAAILCLALAAAGCGPGEPGDNGEAAELKIGMVGPLTGGAASYGVSIKNGVEIAIDEANESGELGDITLKLFAEDTTGDWSQAANAFSKLIEVDKVSVIVGAVLSSETAAGGPIAMDAGIPTISPSSTAVDLTKGNPYLFRNCLSDEVQAYQIAEYAVDELGLSKFAVLFTNNDYGVSLKKAFEEKATELAEVVAVESFMDGDENFKPQLTKIQQQNPDALYIAGYYTEAAKIAQQAAEMGLVVQLLGADGFCSDILVQIGKEAVEGAIFTAGFYAGDPSPDVQNFVTKYRKKFNEEPEMFAAHGYDAARIVIEAIKNKGADPEQIREGIAETKDFPGITGKTSLDEEGDTLKDVLILQVENGIFIRLR